jgi:predicted CoA-binding protein
MKKTTAILGASNNPSRYAYIAAGMLKDYGHPIIPIGIKKGEVYGEPMADLREKPHFDDVHTVTLYMNPERQKEWYDYILSLSPKRIIFNPGTENYELTQQAEAQGIETIQACTLVMLRAGQY